MTEESETSKQVKTLQKLLIEETIKMESLDDRLHMLPVLLEGIDLLVLKETQS